MDTEIRSDESTVYRWGNKHAALENYKMPSLEFIPRPMRGFEVVPDEHRRFPDIDIILPTRGSRKSAGYDIYCPTNIEIPPGETVRVFTDIRVRMQDNEFFWITPRSSTGKIKVMIAQTAGIVDADYYGNPQTGGNLLMVLHNYGTLHVTIKRGERVLQGIFQEYLLVDGDDFQTGAERVGGFGHTGA